MLLPSYQIEKLLWANFTKGSLRITYQWPLPVTNCSTVSVLLRFIFFNHSFHHILYSVLQFFICSVSRGWLCTLWVTNASLWHFFLCTKYKERNVTVLVNILESFLIIWPVQIWVTTFVCGKEIQNMGLSRIKRDLWSPLVVLCHTVNGSGI